MYLLEFQFNLVLTIQIFTSMTYHTFFLPILDKEGAEDSLPIIEDDLLKDGFIPLMLVTDQNNELIKEISQQYPDHRLYGVIIYLDYIDSIVT